MNWGETIFATLFVCIVCSIGWHFSIKAENCLPFKIGGAMHLGDICGVKR